MTEDLRPAAGAVRAPAVLAGLCLATAAYSVLQSLVVPALGVFRASWAPPRPAPPGS